MRLWSLHPRHLDRMGLVAAWREALLAQAVLAGQTRGYQRHPQLIRFREADEPLDLVGGFLLGLHDEAVARGYRFDRTKIHRGEISGHFVTRPTVTQGQLDYEWLHLGEKLARRSPGDAERWKLAVPTPHPLFTVKPGGVEYWERTGSE